MMDIETKLHQQVVNKVLPITKTFILDSLFYLFDNATSHFVYAKDALQVKNINKRCKKKNLYCVINNLTKEELRLHSQ